MCVCVCVRVCVFSFFGNRIAKIIQQKTNFNILLITE